ncbi:Methyltransferase domain-containing protein [Variovorax sp. CF079]|uniref:class I SAM-dependent methyltransferase n=1 Tax=Variovorax sp. CF079 TaxID=1882774 RepID=UPI00088A7CCB|nr:class I SAM-dependent methyltransferase [Variovorax sp. CF079]SDD65188.1 Methyltransferase domain-containing protein [Variovorax sp. CF079]
MAVFVATDPEGYEAYVGRGSQRLAPSVVRFAGVSANEAVLDVGCGTGHLTRAISLAGARATGVDLSPSYVEFAQRVTARQDVVFEVGDALNLSYQDGVFDRALSMLALDVLPDSAQGLREMKRVTRKGGMVTVVVNNFRCGWTPFSLVWDAAAVLDADGAAMRDEMVSKALGWPGGLADLFEAASFTAVVEDQLAALFEYQSFDDYWSTFLTGQGKTGNYVTQLAMSKRDELKHRVRAAYLCGLPDGPRALTTSFWAVRGVV